jgi:hypothetical protein
MKGFEMKIKTSELIGFALDWAVAKCEGLLHDDGTVSDYWQPSELWEQGGPIIERDGINIIQSGSWFAEMDADHSGGVIYAEGGTPLIAAMRCYVASKRGDEVEIPENLK